MKLFTSAAILALTAATATTVQAATINPMNEIAPVGSTNSPGNWGRGYSFTADVADLFVTELGLATPFAQVHEIALWDLTNSVRMALVTGIQSIADTWVFQSIAPVALTQGNLYAVTLYGDSGESYYYTNSPSFLPDTTEISYVDMRYCNGCDESGLPTTILNGYNYGYVDIGYQIGNPSAVPLPAAGLLLLGAMGGLALMRRRKPSA